MAVTVHLPAALAQGTDAAVEIDGVCSIGELVDALERRLPGIGACLDDALFSFAVNDELLLHHERERTLRDGDRVEIVPVLSGG